LRSGAFREFAVGGAELQAVAGMIEDAHRNGAVAVLMETPVMERDLADLLPGGSADLAAFRAALDSIAPATGFPVLRFPDLADRAELFADEYHLNGAGVAVVTGRLALALEPIWGIAPPAGSCAQADVGMP